MTIDGAYCAANTLIEKYDTRDPDTLARALGIKVLYEPMGYSSGCCKGFCLFHAGNIAIAVNSNLDELLQPLVLAHELGHAVLHQSAVDNRTFSDILLYNSNTLFEYEANIFAAEILLHDNDVFDAINNEGATFFNVASILGVPPDFLNFKYKILNHKGFSPQSPIACYNSNFLK